MGAISLVFGTAKQGVELPVLDARFETTVPGVFIAGELGGMGLIRNAVRQGREAIDALRERSDPREQWQFDVLIVGAGPAGIAASLRAEELGLRYRTIEQDTFGGTVAHYPRGKIVMTAPMDLPLYGKVKLRETTKERLLDLWQEVLRKTGIQIREGEALESLQRNGDGFEVKTSKGIYTARNVLLAVGRRGSPRKLEVPGEESSKVVYRLIEPEQYRGKHVVVVGGGDSALEAACTLSQLGDTQVTLTYRGTAFSRAKPKNRHEVERLRVKGSLSVRFATSIREIDAKTVTLVRGQHVEKIANDAVLVCAGGVLPMGMLNAIGVEIVTKYGTV